MLFAIERLELLSLRPSHRLSLAIRFRIRGWLDASIRELLLAPAAKLDLQDFINVNGPEGRHINIVYMIVKAREHILRHRSLLAIKPIVLSLHSQQRPWCPDDQHKKCIRLIEESWVKHIGPKILHETDPLDLFNPTTVDTYLRSQSNHFRGVRQDCFTEMCDDAQRGGKLTQLATHVLEKVIVAVAEYVGANPVLEGPHVIVSQA